MFGKNINPNPDLLRPVIFAVGASSSLNVKFKEAAFKMFEVFNDKHLKLAEKS